MIAPPHQVMPLGDHDRAAFSCGKPSLDDYIRQTAGQDERADPSRCFMLVNAEADPHRILAYHTLTNTAVATHLGPEKTCKIRRYPEVGAVLLGRFALDASQQGQGLGRRLMLHIFVHVARLGRDSGFQLLVVDPLDD